MTIVHVFSLVWSGIWLVVVGFNLSVPLREEKWTQGIAFSLATLVSSVPLHGRIWGWW